MVLSWWRRKTERRTQSRLPGRGLLAVSKHVHPFLERLEDRTVLTGPGPLSTTNWTALGPMPIVNGYSTTDNFMPVSGRVTGIAVAPATTSFLPAGNFFSGGSAYVVSGDFNGDGIPDLVTGPAFFNDEGSTVSLSLLPGNGDGTFAAPVSLEFPGYVSSSTIVAGDFTGDGVDDLAVDCYDLSVPYYCTAILLNDGHGNFTVSQAISGTGDLAVGNFFGDGRTSLAIANGSGVVTFYQNNGAGTFTQRGTVATAAGAGENGIGIIAANLSGNNSPDIALADAGNHCVSILTNNGTGTFTYTGSFAVGTATTGTTWVTAGDFNDDGSVDLATVNQGPSGQDDTVTVLLNQGNGAFTRGGDYDTGIATFAPALVAGDFLGHGHADLALVDYSGDRVLVMANNGAGVFTVSTSIPVDAQPDDIIAADLNNDGTLDLVSANYDAGDVSAILQQPQTSPIYIATAGGGVWKSGDNGATWQPLTDNLTDSKGQPIPMFMGSITVDPLNANVVYAGTGEANNGGDDYYGVGILKSTDAGQTWTLLNDGGIFQGKTMARIIVDPTNADTNDDIVYAAVDDNGVNGPGKTTGTYTNTGIYKSADGGLTWVNTTANMPNGTIQTYSDLVIDPHQHETLYMAIGSPGGFAQNGVYKTTNGGLGWDPLPGAPQGTQDGRITLALASNAAGSSTLYVSIAGSGTIAKKGTLYKMLRSTNGGASFDSLPEFSPLLPVPDYMNGAGWYATALAVLPTNPQIVFASGTSNGSGFDVIMSTDGGNIWTNVTSSSAPGTIGVHADSHALVFDNSGKLLEGDDGGIFRMDSSSPGNIQWSDLNTNLQITQFTGIALDPNNPNIAYGGSQDNGTEVFNNDLGWTQFSFGDGGFVRVDPTNSATVYSEQYNISLSRSDAFGANSKYAKTGLFAGPLDVNGNPTNQIVAFYAPYVLDASGDVFYGSDNLFESRNKGVTWTPIGRPGSNNFNPADQSLKVIALAPSDPNTIYVSASGYVNGHVVAHIFVTTDANLGINADWTQVDVPTFSDSFGGLAVDPANPRIAYVVRNEFTAAGTAGGHVFETTNDGATWTDISGNLPNFPVNSIVLDPRGTSGSHVIYVGTDVGLYASADGGATWQRYGSGLPNVQVTDIEIAPQLNILAVGTHGRGMYEILLAGPADPTQSTVAFAAPKIQVGGATTITLTARDVNGTLTTGGASVQFQVLSGSGAFGAATDNGNGTYTATFSATSTAGTVTATATINGQAITTAPATLHVNPGAFDLKESTVTLSVPVIPIGGTTVATLTVRDSSDNQLESGGLDVAFGLGGSAPLGTFGPVTDHGDGTYTATFTGQLPGQNAVLATINGQTLTSAPPTVSIYGLP